MLRVVFGMQRQTRYIIQGIIFLVIFMVLYTMIDLLNMSYTEMMDQYGVWLVVGNVALNMLMSMIAMFMINLSSALVRISGKEGKGTFLSAVSVLFGMMTYGCTPCVIAFFATIGITFSVVALPLAGLPYKLISLAILVLGGIWLLWEINRAKCKIPKENAEHINE
jgi:magnesium-transporting ATPase (P-type)